MNQIVIENIAIENNDELLDVLMDQYGQSILQLVYSYVKNHAVAEELTQEIFIKAYERIDTYKQEAAIKTWLWRIAINYCKDYLRSWHYRKVIINEKLTMNTSSNAESVEAVVEKRDEDAELALEVFRLPIKYREVIYFHFYEEMTIVEISSVTGINQNTIKTRLRKAKELLKAKLEGKV